MAIFSLKDLRAQVSPEWQKVSDEELVVAYAQNTGQDAQQVAEKLGVDTGVGKGALVAGFGMGVDQAQAMIGGTGAAIADAFGATGVRDALESGVRQQQAQALLARDPTVPQRIEDVKGLGDFGSFALGQAGQQIPIMGGILGASVLGTMAGGPVGGVAAGLGTGYTYGAGSLYNEALEGGERKTSEALLKAVPYAAAESLVPLGLGKVARGALGSNLIRATTRKGAIAQAAGGGAVTEAATEAFQTGLEIGMRDDLTPEEKYSRYLNAVASGGLVGGGFSGVAGGFAKLPPKPETDPAPVTNNETGETDLAASPEQRSEVQRVNDNIARVEARERQIAMDRMDAQAAQAVEAQRAQQVQALEEVASQELDTERLKATQNTRRKLIRKRKSLEAQLREPKIGKKTPARTAKKMRVAYEERLAKLQPEIDRLNQDIAGLDDTLGRHTEGRKAKKALAEFKRSGMLPAEADNYQSALADALTAQEVDLEADTAADTAADTEVEAPAAAQAQADVSPVVAEETLQDGTDLTQQAGTAEAVSPVQEFNDTEELVSEAEIAASEQIAAEKLDAAVRSVNRKASGELTLSQPILAALARHLRSYTRNGFAKVYQPNSGIVDEQATAEAKDFLDGVRERYQAIARVSNLVGNTVPNITGTSNKENQFATDEDTDLEIAVATGKLEDRTTGLAALRELIEDFVDYVGGETNATAIVAVMKAMNDKKRSPDSVQQQSSAEYAQSVFGTRENTGLYRVSPTKVGSKAKFAALLDTSFSTALRQYVNGELDEATDIAPKGRVVRPNFENLSREKRAKVPLGYKPLEKAAEQGVLSKGRKAADVPKKLAKKEQDYKDRVDYVKNRFKAGEINEEQRDSQLATAERKLKEAQESYQRETQELKDSKGLIAVVTRALDLSAPTVTGSMIGKALRLVLKAMPKSQHPTFEFTTDKNSSYDPNKGKGGHIRFRQEVSPEEVAHEVLHALLQGVVYRNSDLKTAENREIAEAVEVLRGYVRSIITTDLSKVSMPEASRTEAERVVQVLRVLVNKGNEVDAILELISYGNTMRDFKLLLNNLPKTRNKATANWKANVRGIWEFIRKLINLALGRNIENTAANDIIDASVKLLSEVEAEPSRAKPQKGGAVLRQEQPQTETKSVPDLRDYGTERTYGFTKPLFDMLSAVLPEGAPAKVKQLVKETRDALVKKHPNLEKVLRNFDPTLMFGDKLQKIFAAYKAEKHTTVQLAELVTNDLRKLIVSNPEVADKLIAYLDGDKTALNGVADTAVIKMQADGFLEKLRDDIQYLPQEFQDFFNSRKFSEALIFVNKESDIGSGTVGQRKLSKLFGSRVITEENVNPEWVGAIDKVQPDSPIEYYQVMELDENGNPMLDSLGKHGFAASSVALKNGQPITLTDDGKKFVVDPSVKWRLSSAKNKKFRFTSNSSIAEVKKKLDKHKAAEEIGIAILNTAHTVSTYGASKTFFEGLANLGRNADGSFDKAAIERGEVPVVFKDEDEYNQFLEMTTPEGETFRPFTKKAIKANKSELRTGAVNNELRATGTLVRMPDTKAMESEGAPIKVWGDLAGKVVSGPVYSAIQDMSSKHTMFNSGAMRSYNNMLRQFKLSKTTRNPGTHITNVASNVTIMMMHGISFQTLKKAAWLLANASANPDKLAADPRDLQLLKEFQKSGALLGNFSAAEVKQSRYAEIAKAIKVDADKQGVIGRVAELLKLESDGPMKAARRLKGWDESMLRLYAAEDNVFRLAAFMTRAGQLQAEGNVDLTDAQWKQAGDFGREAFLNYDIDAKFLQYARQTVMPFASWTYAAIPMLARIAITRPWMIANVLTSYALLDAAMSAMAGDDDEETRKKMGKLYTEKLFFGIGPNSMIRLPFLGDAQNPVYFRLGDYIPLVSTFRGTPAGTAGFDWWPQGFSANGPLVSLFGALMGVDTYTGKPMNRPTDDFMDLTMNNLGAVYDVFAPPIISGRNVKKVYELGTGAKDITGRDISPIFALRAAGLKFYNPNEIEQSMYQRIEERQIRRDYGMAISKIKREELRSGAPDYDRLYRELTSLREEMREEIDKLYGRD